MNPFQWFVCHRSSIIVWCRVSELCFMREMITGVFSNNLLSWVVIFMRVDVHIMGICCCCLNFCVSLWWAYQLSCATIFNTASCLIISLIQKSVFFKAQVFISSWKFWWLKILIKQHELQFSYCLKAYNCAFCVLISM